MTNQLDKSFQKALQSIKKTKKNNAYGIRHSAKSETISELKDVFPKGSTVYLTLRKRSASNLSREIGFISFQVKGKQITDLHPNYAVAEVLGLKLNKNGDGIKIGGVGMDMGLHLVSNLAHALYGDESSLKHRWL